MTNFDFLKTDAKFAPFAETAIAAEMIYRIDIAASVTNCRRAMEFAVKWMYAVDADLRMPYQDELLTLINTDDFRDIVGKDLINRLQYLRKLGNSVIHTSLCADHAGYDRGTDTQSVYRSYAQCGGGLTTPPLCQQD